jgi:hypothetical protein
MNTFLIIQPEQLANKVYHTWTHLYELGVTQISLAFSGFSSIYWVHNSTFSCRAGLTIAMRDAA